MSKWLRHGDAGTRIFPEGTIIHYKDLWGNLHISKSCDIYWGNVEYYKVMDRSNKNFTQEEWEKFWDEEDLAHEKDPIVEWRYNREAYEWEPYREEDLVQEGEGIYSTATMHELDKADAAKAEDGKQKPSLAGLPPKVLEQEAQVMGFGGNKYYFGKWLKEPTTQYKRVDSALRHINKWLQGVDLDDESNLPHLVHAIVQLTMAQEYSNRGICDGR